jgi:hypothetical protein
MKQEYKLAIKSMVFAQSFIDTLDQFKGTNSYKHQLKQKGNSFEKEVDKFLNTSYCGGETDSNVLALIDECQKAIDKVLDEQVELI